MHAVTDQGGNEPRGLAAATAAFVDDSDPVLAVLDRTLDVVRSAGVPFLVIGEIASAVWGRDRGTNDIDLFVRPEVSPRLLELLADDGFDTEVVYEHWLSKAHVDGVDVDIIYRASRDILLDDEMIERAAWVDYRGRRIPVAPPEDLVVMKAGATREDTARYWYDALGILSTATLDWDYLVKRSRQHGPRRMLSLLLFATSVDMVVPSGPIRELFAAVSGDPADA
jgi:predicted nucleotidyltransferase